MAGVEGVPGGHLAVEPGADLHPCREGVAGEGGRVGARGKVGAQQVVLAVPVRAVREAPVGGDGGEGVRARKKRLVKRGWPVEDRPGRIVLPAPEQVPGIGAERSDADS